jgi:glycosyltransferase involved in cell wall biosynthesis
MFPSSWWADRSKQNFRDKKAAFTSLPKERFTIVPVSRWIKGEMLQSFLKKYDFRVIHNGIDTNVFTIYDPTEVKRKYQLEGKRIILGVASIWCEEKGWNDFMRLAEQLDEHERLVLVGVDEKHQAMLPKHVTGISRTENIRQLAELYSAAEVFVNPTWQDNYPTVNLEAIACGTPVVTYRTGGSIEAVTEHTGLVVEQGDIDGLLKAIRTIEERGKAYYQQPCRAYALANFKKEDRYAEYLRLYDELICRNKNLE